MTKPLSLIGLKFSKLEVIERSTNTKQGMTRWKCLCDCGKYAVVKGTSLVKLKTKSCGCLSVENASTINKTHGLTGTPEHQSWRGMKERCNNPKNSHYELYGARGISYPDAWNDFSVFLEDMGNRPEGTQLDRIDVNLSYSKDNCKWSDLTQQAFNIRLKSNNKSGRTGVSFNKKLSKYTAMITHYKVVKFLGVFDSFEDACKAREKAEIELYGFSKE